MRIAPLFMFGTLKINAYLCNRKSSLKANTTPTIIKHMKKYYLLVIAVLLILVIAPRIHASDEQEDNATEQVSYSTAPENTTDSALEIPALTSPLPSQTLRRLGYTTSYNPETRCPNWVAWHLTAARTEGPYKRDGIPYAEDEEAKYPRQTTDDWQGRQKGYDHGHMCPAGDCKWDREAMRQTFLLTNMCPQNSNLNRGDWQELEDRCRGWARHYGDLYIVCGPLYTHTPHTKMGSSLVSIPDAFFKVVLRLGKRPAALGFIYANEQCNNRLSHYVKTVDEVEELTGMDFFSLLPDSIENHIEAEADISKW